MAILSMARDVTAHKRAEEQLRNFHQQLRALAAHLQSVREEDSGRPMRQHNPLLKILIADDHAIVRRGVKDTLADAFAGAQFGEAGNAAQALALVRKQPWDILILDINLPGRSGLEVLKDVKQERPHLPVLMLSMHSEEQIAIRALKAGAAGYVTKDKTPEELVQAVRKILGGGKYVSPALAEHLAAAVMTDDKPPHEALSDREYQVMRLLAAGQRVGAIAKELFLTVTTIKTYRARILEKLSVKNNVELAHYALRHRLVS